MRTLIITVVAIGIASVVATIFVGTATFDGTVVRDPYEEGLRWDTARNARLAAGWSMTVVDRDLPVGRSELKIWIADRRHSPLEGASVTFSLGRLETDRYDRDYRAGNLKPGIYGALVDLPLPGTWYIRSTVTKAGRTVLLEDRLSISKDR